MKNLLATITPAGEWALEMLSISGPSGEPLIDIRSRKVDGSLEGNGVTLTLEELRRMLTAYIEWEEEGGSLEKSRRLSFKRLSAIHIKELIAVLGKTSDEFHKELTVVSHHDKPPRFDVRDWKKNHEGSIFGKTFTTKEMDKMVEIYESYFGPLPRKNEHWWE